MSEVATTTTTPAAGSTAPRAEALGLIGCEACALVVQDDGDHDARCPRCHEPLHRRKPASLARCWAFLVASAFLYIPANVLPVMHTSMLRDAHADTILSGVVYLWHAGSYDLAVIVFTASVVVPVLKIITLSTLLITTQRRSHWRQRERTKLYRAIEFIGYWSMLDVFVVALLVTLVRFGALAEIRPAPGIVAFGSVVVLTMLASMSFDSRLIWDTERH
jgi:paraquat-inducible protein A